MGNRNLTNVALSAEMLAMFGPTGTASLMGWCLLAGVYGAGDARSFIEMPVGGLSTRYKRLAEIRALRAALIDKGYDMTPEEDPVLAVARVAVGSI